MPKPPAGSPEAQSRIAAIARTNSQFRLSIVIVNHESWPDVTRLVHALASSPAFQAGTCEIVVVDNASREPIPRALTDPPAGVRVIARRDNGGFAVGVNAGWRNSASPWLLVLNPDVEVEPDFLGQVLARMEHYDSLERPPGIVGYSIRNGDGSPQGSVGVFPSLVRAAWEQLLPRSRRKYLPGWRIRTGPVDWVTGCCMLVNRSMMDAIGGMDEDFFLYYEEVAFAWRARRLGWEVAFDAGASVIHRHPLQNRPVLPKMRVIIRHSKLLYFLKHLPYWQFLVLDGIVAIEARVRGFLAARMGVEEDARAWRIIGRIARRLRNEGEPRGRAVLELAREAEAPEPAPRSAIATSFPHGRSSTPVRSRQEAQQGRT